MGRGNRKIDDFFLAGREMKLVGGRPLRDGHPDQRHHLRGDHRPGLHAGDELPRRLLRPARSRWSSSASPSSPSSTGPGVYTAYQYLERRFDSRTRTLTSLLFLVSRGLSVGVTLYAPSLVLSVILGWSETATILLMGGTTIALRRLRRQQVGDLDGRGPDGHHLVRDLRLRGSGGDAAPPGLLPPRFARRRPAHEPPGDHGHLAGSLPALHALERGHRGDVPGHGLLRGRPEPGAALPLRKEPHGEPPLPALQRVPQGPDAVPDPAHRRPRVRVLPLRASTASLEHGGSAKTRDVPACSRARLSARTLPGCPPCSPGRRLRIRPLAQRRLARRLSRRERPPLCHPRRSGPQGPGPVRQALQRHELHLSFLRRHAAPRRPRRARDRRDLRRGDVDALRRVQLPRHRDHGGLLPALREDERERRPLPGGLPSLHRGLGRASPAWSPCRRASSARPSRW